MSHQTLTPENTEFVILSFEGPDLYSMAGGLGMRISQLSQTLADMGFPTHFFFIGDPKLGGEEVRCHGRLTLHRWCQWISGYYPKGVYEGENEKLNDFNESIPWFVMERIIKPAAEQGKIVAVLGEEWQTAEVMCRLSDLLRDHHLRDRVVMFWNANNTFSFHRIDWPRLNHAATITTVSRYMKHILWGMRLNPVVVPNGIPKWLLWSIGAKQAHKLRQAFNGGLMICKVARWDPDKRWDVAIQAAARLKAEGLKPLLLARGGCEPYGQEVIRNARSLGLTVGEARLGPSHDFSAALVEAARADVIDVRFHLPLQFLRVMYRAVDVVLANSGHEPFGLVGLEAMAAGGAVFTGNTGEDYAIHLVNSVVLETADPEEIAGYAMYLRDHPKENAEIRRAARETAGCFTWEAVARNLISKLETAARIQGPLGASNCKPTQAALEWTAATRSAA